MKKVFIITGTRKGIGRQLAEYYLAKGHIVCGCSRGKSAISDKNYAHYKLDVANEDEVIFMIRSIKKKHKFIDVLINNAGIAGMNHILTTPYENAKKIFDTNFFGTFLFIRETSKIMIRQKRGRIINFSTIAATLNLEGEAVYAASKIAIESLTRTSAKELAQFGIRVNSISPTPIRTDLIKNINRKKIDNLLKQQAINRFGEFKDIVNVINFLIDKNSDFITGQTIHLGGPI